jgi:hypothetical protein
MQKTFLFVLTLTSIVIAQDNPFGLPGDPALKQPPIGLTAAPELARFIPIH